MLWAAAVIVLLFLFASWNRKAKQRAAVAGLRRHFAPVARMRLVAAFPALEPVLDDASLRLLFDWILTESYRRAGVSSFGQFMRWAVVNGEGEAAWLVFQVAGDAVTRLPRAALAIIDDRDGRIMAGIILDNAMTEAGARIAPGLEKYV